MLEKLTIQDFTKRLNETFSIHLEETGNRKQETIRMELIEVTSLGVPSEGQEGRGSFSCLFDGPEDPILPQQIYTLKHEEMGPLELFLVPLGPRGKGIIYEAVFY
jgi:hypothetical protein